MVLSVHSWKCSSIKFVNHVGALKSKQNICGMDICRTKCFTITGLTNTHHIPYKRWRKEIVHICIWFSFIYCRRYVWVFVLSLFILNLLHYTCTLQKQVGYAVTVPRNCWQWNWWQHRTGEKLSNVFDVQGLQIRDKFLLRSIGLR